MTARKWIGLSVGILFIMLLIGKAYAQANYPVAVRVEVINPPTTNLELRSKNNERVSIWSRH